MTAEKKKPVLARNKKARFEYEILETVEAGMVLEGPEVKSIRQGRVSFQDGHVRFSGGEAYLLGVFVAPYENRGYAPHDPERPKKLLLHRREIEQFTAKVEQKGLSVIPLNLHLRQGKIKVELALARGRKQQDRREELKQRAVDREVARETAKYR